jgi:hypothetical protein
LVTCVCLLVYVEFFYSVQHFSFLGGVQDAHSFFLLSPVGGFLPEGVLQIAIFFFVLPVVLRVFFIAYAKGAAHLTYLTAFCIGCMSLHIHHFLCTLQVVVCDELVITVYQCCYRC